MASDDDILKQAYEHFQKKFDNQAAGEVPPEEIEARRRRELNEKEVKVVGVYQHPSGGAFVLLRDSRGRNLPIWIGEPEAVSISLAIESSGTPRPMTHDLTKILVERLGGTIEFILVDDLHNNVYYAKIVLQQNGKPLEVDCRPSDAIALALRFRAPIYVADDVLEEGHWPEVAEE
ncbi:MAG TPA: bifunctional nuclease family protein [Armatimonadota bacterium]|nr:bifunctional nuclease family protein [Armatimonadota bacterium]